MMLNPRQAQGAIAGVMLLVMCAPAAVSEEILRSRLVAPAEPLTYFDHTREGRRLFDEQKYSEAAEVFQKAVSQYPKDGSVWIQLGQALRLSNKPREAITAYEKGLELTSTWQPAGVRLSLARAHLVLGNKEMTYRVLERMVQEDQYTQKPALYDHPAFVAIREEPRFLNLVGRIDTSKMSRAEGWRTDIDYLVSEIKRVNHLYRKQPLPEELTARQRALKRDVGKLTDEEIFVGMGRMLSPLKQGHVSLAIFPETTRLAVRTIPLQFYAFPEGIFVVRSDEKNADLVGAEVLRIEDAPPGELVKQIEEHASVENEMKMLWAGMRPLGSIPVLRGLGVLKPGRDEVRLTLKKDGQTVERVLAPVAQEQERKLGPPPVATPPLFVRNVPRVHWLESLPKSDAVFVQVNQIAPDPDESMAEFGLKLRKFLADTPVKNVILDLRHNNGGNTFTYTEVLRTLVAHSTKEGNRLYVIIGRGVYSATSNLISDLERLARPIFVGEPSSGIGNQDGDESMTVLPYSGIRAFLTSVKWQYSHPWDLRTSMVPDIPVQLTAKDYFAGKDSVMETILADIRRARP
ncbi:MAG TPA: tetratricopeptide repeat protein [Gemmatimonadales bacterium]|nr:tetratricopeptide repeat protein [Gemmatimonadales bacterium]